MRGLRSLVFLSKSDGKHSGVDDQGGESGKVIIKSANMRRRAVFVPNWVG